MNVKQINQLSARVAGRIPPPDRTRTPVPVAPLPVAPGEKSKERTGTLARMVLFGGMDPQNARTAFDRYTQGEDPRTVAALVRYFWYVMRTAYAPIDAVARICHAVTQYHDDCGAAYAYTVPAWVRGRTPDATAKYCALYHAALIAGWNGRVFQFACPAYGAAFGIAPQTVDRFRTLCVRHGFASKLEAHPPTGSADGSTAPADVATHPTRRKADLFALAEDVRKALEDNQPLLMRVGSDPALRWLFATPPPEDRAALFRAVFPSA